MEVDPLYPGLIILAAYDCGNAFQSLERSEPVRERIDSRGRREEQVASRVSYGWLRVILEVTGSNPARNRLAETTPDVKTRTTEGLNTDKAHQKCAAMPGNWSPEACNRLP